MKFLGLKHDQELISDKGLFEKIKIQTGIFIDLFTEIANQFPQEILSAVHPFANGSKVSQGSNLENCPYQVLDLIRDFDHQTGFNIRVLQWWGHGLFVILFMGKSSLETYRKAIMNLSKTYHYPKNVPLWSFKDIIAMNQVNTGDSLEDDLPSLEFLQLHKKIEISDITENTYSSIILEIKHILDNTS